MRENEIRVVHNLMKEGLYVQFITTEIVNIGDYFMLIFDGKDRYFQVTEIKADASQIDESYVCVKCKNVGYYHKLRDTPFDSRLLLRQLIFKVTTPDTLKKIEEESRYC